MVSQGCLFAVSGVFLKSFKEVLRVLAKIFKGVSRKFQECFKEVSVRKVPRDGRAFQLVLRWFQG